MDRPTIPPEHLQEASEHLSTIRDFIRFGVSALRQYDAHLGQGTEDYFAESSALVLQTLSLEWSADAEILDAKLLPSEKAEFLSLLERRINERVPTSYLLNLAYFFNKPFYVDERVLIPRSPIAEAIEQRFAPYCLDENGKMREALNNLPENPAPKTPSSITSGRLFANSLVVCTALSTVKSLIQFLNSSIFLSSVFA